jgi:hypothetical protein
MDSVNTAVKSYTGGRIRFFENGFSDERKNSLTIFEEVSYMLN